MKHLFLLMFLVPLIARAQNLVACGKAHAAWAQAAGSWKKASACRKACTGVSDLSSADRYQDCNGALAKMQQAAKAEALPPPLPATTHRPALRFIPPGRFLMGSPKSEAGRDDDEAQHAVELTAPFLMFETEVTQGQWVEVMKTSPSHFAQCGGRCPVERVSWYDAVAYANALSASEGLGACYRLEKCMGEPGTGCPRADDGYCAGTYTCESVERIPSCTGYRLPTEEEWEYAARAGSRGARYGEAGTIAWYDGNSGGTPHAAGEKAANGFGLRDMLGNVWEWCEDWKEPYDPKVKQNPSGPPRGGERVLRGGTWDNSVRRVRAANRSAVRPAGRDRWTGFRLVRAPSS